MTQFQTFEEIKAWQESRKLVRLIRAICKKDAVKRDFPFVDQITRSARSISANIAEGNDSLSVPEFIMYLGYSKRSCAEVRSHLYDALDEKYIDQNEFGEAAYLTKKICCMLAKLIHYLQSLDQNKKRTLSKIELSKNQKQ